MRQQSSERLELLAPLQAPAEADRCEAIGAEFMERGIYHERQPDHSGTSTSATGLDLLRSLRLSLIERGATLAKLPRDRFANRQLGLDLQTLQALREQPAKILSSYSLSCIDSSPGHTTGARSSSSYYRAWAGNPPQADTSLSGLPAGAGGQVRAKNRPDLARHPCLTSLLPLLRYASKHLAYAGLHQWAWCH